MEGLSSNGRPESELPAPITGTVCPSSRCGYRLMPAQQATLCCVLTLSRFLEPWTGSFPWCPSG